MDHGEVGRYWDENAEVWTLLSRQGFDVYRDFLNTPAFLAMLPEVAGLRGLDVGCGEGHNTRLLRNRGAAMTGVDISPAFVRYAQAANPAGSDGVRYLIASGQQIPFQPASFEFVTAFMSLMDMPEPAVALTEVSRVLKPSGFLQFSIVHPCFASKHRKPPNYFDQPDNEIDEWLFSAAPRAIREGLRRFRIPMFRRTLSEWLNSVVSAGLVIEHTAEPRADRATAAKCPAVADTMTHPYFLHVRCRKV